MFDGTSPPYDVTAVPNPLNLYGQTKLKGEQETLSVNKGNISNDGQIYCVHAALLEKYPTLLFICENLVDFNEACLHEETLNLHTYVSIFPMSIVSVDGKQHLVK